MKTKIVEITGAERLSQDEAQLTAEVIGKGGLILFPTETVYGLGCAAQNQKAIERLYRLKGRERGKPLALHLGSIEALFCYVIIGERERRWIERLLPGPYTLVLKASEAAPPVAVSEGKVGVRIPRSWAFREVAAAAGRALAGTSANREGEAPVITPKEAIDRFAPQVDLIIVTSELPSGRSSAVIDLTEDPPGTLRGELPEFI